jgi:hypothetical protein
LGDLLLYLAMLVLGTLVGFKALSAEKEYKWIIKVQYVAIIILVMAMGIRIGADERVINSIRDIGVSSFIITVFVMGGSVLFLFLVRKWMKLDREGMPKND